MQMIRLGLLSLVMLAAVFGFAMDEFGNLAKARSEHPDFFRPGAVMIASHGGEDWYVYCGEAEKCFSAETDDELYEEAEVSAKNHFFNYFVESEKSPDVKVHVVGARRMYQFADGSFRLVVMGVPRKCVNIQKVAKSKPVIASEAAPMALAAVPKSDNVSSLVVTGAPNKKAVSLPSGKVAKVAARVESAKGQEECPVELDEDGKLEVLRSRLERDPDNYRIRIRMARIFARQGSERRALRNYAEAATLIGQAREDHSLTIDDDAIAYLREVAEYEENNGAYALALKHYRILQRTNDRDQARYATDRISRLLIK